MIKCRRGRQSETGNKADIRTKGGVSRNRDVGQMAPEAANPDGGTGRVIVVVDDDAALMEQLKRVWLQLQVADDLHVFSNATDAERDLQDLAAQNNMPPVAAIVLDPDVAGEQTGAFLRAVRHYYGKYQTPVIMWTRDRAKYKVLDGCGADSVLRKPMVLRVIQALDATCQLNWNRFAPYPGNQSARTDANGL